MALTRLVAVVLFAGWLHGQAPAELFEKAPPDVDAALRERVRLFYQAHVDGKFRLADTVVHEDSKDAYFAAEKTRYKGFEIIRINYSENFTRAQVVTAVVTDFAMPGFPSAEARVPVTTFWKLDGGQWWWYVEPPGQGRQTPFGTMKPGEGPGADHPLALLRKMPTAEEIQGQVGVDRTEVRLAPGDAGEVVVTNRMPGPVSLELELPAQAGFEAKLERADLKANEQTRILFRAPASAATGASELRLRVLPVNRVISIRVLTGGADQPPAAGVRP
jgi:hypothetical protein